MAEILTPDICIIGAGAGGLAAARRARRLGAEVVLIERDRMGGARLNTGSLPAGALIAAADHAHAMRTAGRFGIASEEPRPVARQVHDHVRDVMDGFAAGDSIENIVALGVNLVPGDAKFIAPNVVKAGDVTIKARNFIVATGSRPAIPVIPGLDTVPFFTTDTIAENIRKLTHLLIVGAGAAGLEYAQAYRRLGSEVTVIDTATPLSGSDPELVDIALRQLISEGVRVRPNVAITAIQLRSMGIGVTLGEVEAAEALDVSHIFVATGRIPNLDGLDLDKARLRQDKDGKVTLPDSVRTTNPRVLVIGDALGGVSNNSSALHEANAAVDRALSRRSGKLDHSLLPQVVYLDPELAEIGLSEPMARIRLKDNFRVVRASYAETARARARRETQGVAKLILDPAGKILGAGIVGRGAGELIGIISAAMAGGLKAGDLATLPLAYPTFSEVIARLGDAYLRDTTPQSTPRPRFGLSRMLR
ncbi:MAG: Mercuric ion reductase [Devosia sp.]|nr:Mercuric ion reductase [Devosia sp.]